MAFEALRYISEPITDAAGPDNAVSMGRFLISFISITPPSPRIIISGTDTPAPRTEDSVAFAVAIIFGSIDAFIAAVLVLLVSPYSLVISDAIVTGIFFFEGKNIDYSKFFERFYREDQSHNSRISGYGVGLSIARNIINRHKGKIHVTYKNDIIYFNVYFNMVTNTE